MEKKVVLFIHGFASSANSIKAVHLAERFKDCPHVKFFVPDLNPTPKDFRYLTVTGMINRLRQYMIDHRVADMDIIGSSLG